MSDFMAWIRLGTRLMAASPAKFGKTMRAVERIVEAQETIAEHDDQLVLRPERPEKRYLA